MLLVVVVFVLVLSMVVVIVEVLVDSNVIITSPQGGKNFSVHRIQHSVYTIKPVVFSVCPIQYA